MAGRARRRLPDAVSGGLQNGPPHIGVVSAAANYACTGPFGTGSGPRAGLNEG